MAKFSFGVELHPYYDATTVLSEIQLVEELGYDHVWIGDSQLIWRELYVLLGAAASKTSRVYLGSGVTNPMTRVPAVTASAVVTLQELSKGRMIVGVGSGFSSVNTMGRKPATLATLENYVTQIRALCQGRTVPVNGGEMRLTFGGEGKCPPIVLAASGPKMLKLAGRIGDGVILGRGSMKGDMLSKMIEAVNEGRRERSVGDDHFKTFLSVPVCVDANKQKAMAAVRPHVARSILTPRWQLSEAAAAAREKLEGLYDNYEHLNPAAGHAGSVPDEVVPEYAIAGTPSECMEQVARLCEMEIDQITIRPYAVDGAPRRTMIESFAKQVMEPLARNGH